MNTNVNFEIAKQLLDKGYDRIVSSAYHKATSKLIFTNWETVETNDDILIPAAFNLKEDSYLISAPTIAEVVMWLYEKHGIWVQGPFPLKNGKWEWVVFFLKEPLEGSDGFKNRMSIVDETPYYDTPTETYLAAIEYTLKNLIK